MNTTIATIIDRLLPVPIPRDHGPGQATITAHEPVLAAQLAELYVCATRRDEYARVASQRVLADVAKGGTRESSWAWEQIKASVVSDLAHRISTGGTP